MTMTNVFKGILQVKALPATPEKGVIYFVKETEGDGIAKVYFGSRCYGQVNSATAADITRLEELITANSTSISEIEKKLGEWTDSVTTVAQVVVANKTAIETLNGNAETTGSVAHTVSTAVSAAKTELLGEVEETDAKTIAALNDKINSVESAAKTYSIKKLDTTSGENVLEEYALYEDGENGEQAGDTIKIYKDQSLQNVELDGQKLVFTYVLPDGNKTVEVDVSAFLAESEFKNGLQVVDHTVSVKIDETSENFLSVSENGVKLSGVQDAINDAVKDLNAASHTHDNKDLLDTYTQTEANLADAVAKKHEHANKEVLDGITADKVSAWDAAEQNAKDYTNGLLGTGFTTDNTVASVLDGIKTTLSGLTVKTVASEDKTITVTNSDGDFDLKVNTLSVDDAKTNGYIALEKNENGALYGVMYYGGDDVDE